MCGWDVLEVRFFSGKILSGQYHLQMFTANWYPLQASRCCAAVPSPPFRRRVVRLRERSQLWSLHPLCVCDLPGISVALGFTGGENRLLTNCLAGLVSPFHQYQTRPRAVSGNFFRHPRSHPAVMDLVSLGVFLVSSIVSMRCVSMHDYYISALYGYIIQHCPRPVLVWRDVTMTVLYPLCTRIV